MKFEKQTLDRNRRSMEDQNKTLNKAIKDMKTTLENLEEEKNRLKLENSRLKEKSDWLHESTKDVKTLESHNVQLQTSLFDIAQIVLDDADQEENLAASSTPMMMTSVLTRSTSKPLLRSSG